MSNSLSVSGVGAKVIDAATGKKFQEPFMDAVTGKASLKVLKDAVQNYSILGVVYNHRDKILNTAKKAYNNVGAWYVNTSPALRMKAFEENSQTAILNSGAALFGISKDVPKVAYEPLFK